MANWPPKAGQRWSLLRAHRIEDSRIWVKYLEIKKRHQMRGADQAAMQFDNLATERALVAQVLVDTKKPRCKFGEKCFRKNKKHREEFSHPGDLEWDAPDEKKSNVGPDLAEMAARLLESIDQPINEVFLWKSTEEAAEDVLENGIKMRGGVADESRLFYECVADCLKAGGEGSSSDGTRSVLLCRVLCGNAEVVEGGIPSKRQGGKDTY